eukprot:scaffold10470_cov190-Amphora_coffeaeformis.AAC.2
MNDKDDLSEHKSQVRKVPALGPEPTLVSRKEMDMLYRLLLAVSSALDKLEIDYIVTGGSLLGAIRQASILFCEDDVDISILDPYYCADDVDRSIYWTRVIPQLQKALGKDFRYKQNAWEGGDRVYWGHSNVFLDLFVIRKYSNLQELENVLALKANGQAQNPDYVTGIIDTIIEAVKQVGNPSQCVPLKGPFWHFAKRKAVELWPREVYRDYELWPLNQNLQMGPHSGIKGPRLPVLLLKRAFGDDCLSVYYPSIQHGGQQGDKKPSTIANNQHSSPAIKNLLPPKVLPGGTWQHALKIPLEDEHYIPIQPTSKVDRKPNEHCRRALLEYLVKQVVWEQRIMKQELGRELPSRSNTNGHRPRRTVYMDGVFDLFHVGHLAAIRQCAMRGDRVIIGVTGEDDATSYKRKPIIPQEERCTLVAAIAEVDQIVCPCPLIVTEAFMHENSIDLVVHGFVNDQDAERQAEFFAYPMSAGKFERIPYYDGQSTTNIMREIQKSSRI